MKWSGETGNTPAIPQITPEIIAPARKRRAQWPTSDAGGFSLEVRPPQPYASRCGDRESHPPRGEPQSRYMVPQDVHDQAADDRCGDQCGRKLLEEKTDLLGVDLLEMSAQPPVRGCARSNRSAAATNTRAPSPKACKPPTTHHSPLIKVAVSATRGRPRPRRLHTAFYYSTRLSPPRSFVARMICRTASDARFGMHRQIP